MLALVMLAVLLPQVMGSGVDDFWCKVDGQQWISQVTAEQLRAAPHWTREGPVPLQPDGAIRSAKQVLSVMVKESANWHVNCVELMKRGGSWVYRVAFGEISPRPGMRDRQTAQVAVLLDGTAITPTRTDKPAITPVTVSDVYPSTRDVRTDVARPDRREPTSAEGVTPEQVPLFSRYSAGEERWESVATTEQILATPRWTTDGPVRLPPEDAIRSAERLFPVVGMRLEDWRIASVELRRVGDQSWVYTVWYIESWERASQHADFVREALLLVLLDGSGIIPTLRHDKL